MSRMQTGYSRFYIQAIFAVAAAIALSTSACGKKDQGSAPAAPTAPTTTAAPVSTAQIGKVGVPSELDGDSGKTSSDKTGEELTNKLRGEGEERTVKPVPMSKIESVIYYDPSGPTANQIASKIPTIENAGILLAEKVGTDVVSSDGQQLYYSGSGKDTLRARLMSMVEERNAKLDQKTLELDKYLSQTIQLSDFNVDWANRWATLKFVAQQKDHDGKWKLNNFTVEGPLNSREHFKVGNLEQAPYYLLAEAECMDINGDCKTVHIRVQKRISGRMATANIIARHTNAAMHIDGSTKISESNNQDYLRLMEIFRNTVLYPGRYNTVFQLTLITSETIGGASNFAVNMSIPLRNTQGEGLDVIELTGPLVRTKSGQPFNVALNLTPQYTVIAGKAVSNEAYGYSNRFVETISSARLLQNDGLGTLDLEMTIRNKRTNDKEEKVFLNIRRIHTPVGPVRIDVK